jgi:hypothetical protein
VFWELENTKEKLKHNCRLKCHGEKKGNKDQ